jgi:molybdopterin-binding protein
MGRRTSTRNRLPGVITALKLGDIMAQIDIRVGDNHVVSVITREAAEELNLREGDHVVAMVKATEVMVSKDEAGDPSS